MEEEKIEPFSPHGSSIGHTGATWTCEFIPTCRSSAIFSSIRLDLSEPNDFLLSKLLDVQSLVRDRRCSHLRSDSCWCPHRLGVSASIQMKAGCQKMTGYSDTSFPVLIKYGHSYLPVFFLLALFFTISNYLFASLHDPGVLPRPDTDEILQTEKEHNIQTDL